MERRSSRRTTEQGICQHKRLGFRARIYHHASEDGRGKANTKTAVCQQIRMGGKKHSVDGQHDQTKKLPTN